MTQRLRAQLSGPINAPFIQVLTVVFVLGFMLAVGPASALDPAPVWTQDQGDEPAAVPDRPEQDEAVPGGEEPHVSPNGSERDNRNSDPGFGGCIFERRPLELIV